MKRYCTVRGLKTAAVLSLCLVSTLPAVPPSAAQTQAAPQPATPPSQLEVGAFAWEYPMTEEDKAAKLNEWRHNSYSVDRYWGSFPHDLPDAMDMFADNPWALGPWTKYQGNPVVAPTPGAWDQGRFGGGTHNGSILVKDNTFYYIYRGEGHTHNPVTNNEDYVCDIGIATSKDGIHFSKDSMHSPLFRKGADTQYNYEDVNAVKSGDTYYLFCNRWVGTGDRSVGGTPATTGEFLATSKDLLHWTEVGILFPNGPGTHRNGVVLENPQNEAVKVNGKYVMYLDFGLVAYSPDMIHWESMRNPNPIPGGETCFALADYDAARPNNIVLFTGGNHTGHNYAVGEVLLSKTDLLKPAAYLPRSPLFAEKKYPYEDGFTADAPRRLVTSATDCIFFNALTRYKGKWWLYYGGSEYYTCLATSPAK